MMKVKLDISEPYSRTLELVDTTLDVRPLQEMMTVALHLSNNDVLRDGMVSVTEHNVKVVEKVYKRLGYRLEGDLPQRYKVVDTIVRQLAPEMAQLIKRQYTTTLYIQDVKKVELSLKGGKEVKAIAHVTMVAR